MKRLSIIVPIYNVASYIERCIRSIEEQDIPRNEYEIICINDGSTDESRDLVLSMQKEYENIVLIDQENQGVSMARNNGMDMAKGEYILMVDADDFIKPNILIRRLKIMKEFNLDVGYTGYIILDSSEEIEAIYDRENENDIVLTGLEYSNDEGNGDAEKRDAHSSCGVFLKTDFLNSNNFRYLSGVPYLEDGEFMVRIMCLANRVMFITGPVYMRTTRAGSVTQSEIYYSENARNGFISCANHLSDFQKNSCKSLDQKAYMNQHIIHFTIITIISLKIIDYIRHYSKIYKSLKRGSLKKLDTGSCSEWYKKMGRFYNCSIHCFYLNWIFYKAQKSLKVKMKKISNIR